MPVPTILIVRETDDDYPGIDFYRSYSDGDCSPRYGSMEGARRHWATVAKIAAIVKARKAQLATEKVAA